jgi:hypothetical protein
MRTSYQFPDVEDFLVENSESHNHEDHQGCELFFKFKEGEIGAVHSWIRKISAFGK